MMSDDNDDDDVVTRITHNVAVISDIATSLLQQLTRTRSFVNIIRKINGRVNELSDLHSVLKGRTFYSNKNIADVKCQLRRTLDGLNG